MVSGNFYFLQFVQIGVNQFLAESGATACKDLKGVETGKVLRACPDCIRGAAAIAERVLFAD